MNPHHAVRALAPLALFVLVAPARAQESAGQLIGKVTKVNGVPQNELQLSQSELVLDQVPVRNVDPDELFQVVHGLVNRSYFVKENPVSRLTSLRMLGTSIVIYDTKEQVQRVRELVAKLDVDEPEDAESAWETAEYKPRFVSLETVVASIKNGLEHYNRVEERGLVVLRGPRAKLEEVQALLKRIDVPQRQVLLTCQLIEYGGSAQGPALPRELTDNLERLLHASSFSQVGMGMLRTAVGSESTVSLQLESTGKRYQFSFRPVAFDETSGSLSVSNCSLTELIDENRRELFKTDALLRGGEYTVLAATGATPRLLVVRVTQ